MDPTAVGDSEDPCAAACGEISPVVRSQGIAKRCTWTAFGLLLAGTFVWWVVTKVEQAREAAARAMCNISGIKLALWNYADDHGTLPPAVVYSVQGEPLYSWRVLILPYIDHRWLYDEFRLDEPWDSEHNIRLLEHMPVSYAAPWNKYVDVPPGHTVIKVFVGPGTLFESPEGVPYPHFPADNASDTLLFAEAGDPVPWTKPEDIPYDPAGPVDVRGLFRDGFRAEGVSGRRIISHNADQQALHRLIVHEPEPSSDAPSEAETAPSEAADLPPGVYPEPIRPQL